MPLVLATSCVPDALDGAEALETFRQANLPRACLMPGRPCGDTWLPVAKAFGDGVWLHHACLDSPAEPAWNLAAKDEDVRKLAIARAKETMRIAAGLGAPSYSLHPGFALATTIGPDGEPLSAEVPRERALDQLCRSLDSLANAADDLHLELWVENGYPSPKGPGRLLTTPDEIERVLSRVAAPLIGLWLDVAHLMITCGARRWDPEEVLPAYLPHVRAIALSHTDGRTDGHGWPRPEGSETSLARQAGGTSLPVVIEAREMPREGWDEALGALAEALVPAPSTVTSSAWNPR